MKRHVMVYSKETEMLVERHILEDLPLDELREILIPDPDDQNFILCYDIGKKGSQFFKERYNIDFDFKSYDYVLETRS